MTSWVLPRPVSPGAWHDFSQPSICAGPYLSTGATGTRTPQPGQTKAVSPNLVKSYFCFICLKPSGLVDAGYKLAPGRTLAFSSEEKVGRRGHSTMLSQKVPGKFLYPNPLCLQGWCCRLSELLWYLGITPCRTSLEHKGQTNSLLQHFCAPKGHSIM